MSSTFNGSRPVEISENGNGEVCIRQLSENGDEQTVRLSLNQAEHLANWCIHYARSVTEGLLEE